MKSKRVVLLGGGHAHSLVLLGLARQGLPEAEVTLVSPEEKQPYSGMVPGYLAGHYGLDEINIDVARLARRVGARFVRGRVAALDAGRSHVRLEDGSELEYDIVSLDVGAEIRPPFPGAQYAVPARPLAAFLEKLGALKSGNLALIGAGPAGAELAMALAYRGLRVTLYGEASPPSELLAALARNSVTLRLETVLALEAGPAVVTKDTKAIFDLVLLATGPTAPAWLRGSGLTLDQQGFVLVEKSLRSVSDAKVFAVGDCATLRDAPHAKSGVFAVRHAEVLSRNLRAAAAGSHREAIYSAQRKSLMLISCGERRAIAQWGAWRAEGAWIWRVKDAIDRRWIARFS